MLERRFEVRIFEIVTVIQEAFWYDACRIDQQRVSHFSENEIYREFRQGQKCRPVEHLTERLGKFFICNGMRASYVYRAAYLLILDRKTDNFHTIIERHPAHPLLTAADNAADTELERRQHRRECATVFRQNDAVSK